MLLPPFEDEEEEVANLADAAVEATKVDRLLEAFTEDNARVDVLVFEGTRPAAS